MPYIGHSPTQAGSYIEVDDFGSSFNGSNVAFTLQVGGVNITPNQQNLLVMIDGVLQQPTDAFAVSGSTITFTEAPANGADLYCLLMGQSASIGNGTIGADELKISGNGTNNQLLKTDGDGTFSYINQNTVTASTAATLATARAINGVNFDGSAAITVTADANTLSNTTLKSTVVNSSLTSVGTLTSLTSSGTISSSTSSTTDSALTLTDAGVADYKFTFPDTSTIRLSTNTSSTKVFDLSNAGSGKMKLSVDGGLRPITGSDYSLVLESTNELNFYNADGYADSNRATLHINYSGTGSTVDLSNSELVVVKGTGSTFAGVVTASGSTGSNYIGSFTNTSATGWGLFVKGGADNADYALRVQDKDAGDLLSVKSGGSIGVGTNDPSSAANVLLSVGNTSLAYSGMEFIAGSNAERWRLYTSFDGNNDALFGLYRVADSSYKFQIGESGNATFAGTITASSVINTDTDYLDGDATLYLANSGLKTDNTTSAGTMIKFGDTNAGLVYGSSGNGTFKLMQRENTAVFIDASRNIGIGTTSPSSKLHVVGDAVLQATGATDSVVGQIRCADGNNAATFRTTTSGKVFRIKSQNSGYIYIDSTNPISFLNGGAAQGAQFRYVFAGTTYVSSLSDGNISADSFTDRTPYPETTSLAWDVINSHQKLSEEKYNADDKKHQLDDESLDNYVKVQMTNKDGSNVYGRDLSATVSCLVDVVKDLQKQIKALENA